jgi:uncharacterized membrane protein
MISSMRVRRPTAAAGLVVLLTGSGVLHLVVPASFDAIVPEQLPGAARTWTHLSGVTELVIAALIAAPAPDGSVGCSPRCCSSRCSQPT